MSRAHETETEKAAEQDGKREVRCRCDHGGKCHRPLHKEGTQCERMIVLTGTSRHRKCKGCRSPKKRKVCSEDVETTTSVDDEGSDEPAFLPPNQLDLRNAAKSYHVGIASISWVNLHRQSLMFASIDIVTGFRLPLATLDTAIRDSRRCD